MLALWCAKQYGEMLALHKLLGFGSRYAGCWRISGMRSAGVAFLLMVSCARRQRFLYAAKGGECAAFCARLPSAPRKHEGLSTAPSTEHDWSSPPLYFRAIASAE